MGQKIIVDKTAIEKIIQHAQTLNEYTKRSKIKGYNETMREDEDNNFTKNELLAIDYIRKNPGCIKQKLVDYFQSIGSLSRRPAWNIMDKLIDDGIIISSPDENNSQIHHLFINTDNIIAMKLLELDDFQNSFLSLLIKLKDSKAEHSVENDSDIDARGFLLYLIEIYRHVLNSYIVYALLDWPFSIKDKTYARKLLNIVISKMTDLLFKMSELFKIKINLPPFEQATVGTLYSPVIGNFVQECFLLHPAFLMNLHRQSKKINLRNDIHGLLNDAWKISFKIYPYTGLADDFLFQEPYLHLSEEQITERRKLKEMLKNDWRSSLAAYKEKLKKSGIPFDLEDALEPSSKF